MSFKEMLHAYLAGPELLKKAIAGMSVEQLKSRPVEGKWSTLEVVAHISDFEPILADRMKRIIAMERPLLMVADENLYTLELMYNDRDVNEELAVIETTRKQMGRILSQIAPEKTSKSGVHSQKGLVSLEAVLTAAVNHIPHHLKFIQEKRTALGC